jgi:putative Mg2+ transporter-C (MgtC) family protein
MNDPLFRDAALLFLSWFLGGIIGWQREAQGRAAGLRTHMLVCSGSCLITLVSFGTHDPGRIAAQIVTGIGFLGAGVILRRGVSVRGLTTAATVWVVAGIGIAVGAGSVQSRFAWLAAIGTLLAFLTLTLIEMVEKRIIRARPVVTLLIPLPRNQGAVARLMEAITETGAYVLNVQSEETHDEENHRLFTIEIQLPPDVPQSVLAGTVAAAFPESEAQWE